MYFDYISRYRGFPNTSLKYCRLRVRKSLSTVFTFNTELTAKRKERNNRYGKSIDGKTPQKSIERYRAD